MKKLLLILLCLPLLFVTCKKEENSPTNNTGSDVNSFLSLNDGSVWECQDCSRGTLSSGGGWGISDGDSLIGFYNAENFMYERWKSNDTLPCFVYYESTRNSSTLTITKNTQSEFEITDSWFAGSSLALIRKFTLQGNNQLVHEVMFRDEYGNVFSINHGCAGGTLYIRSTTLQNLSCN